jgi:hypothetical protein
MANRIEQFSRLINHRVTGQGVAFTNPTSNDHTDETWSETDLYIGEIGINVTDDTIFMRTNNGIVEISTTTQSSSTASVGLWVINNSNELQIGTTYSPTAIVPGVGYFTDLGSSSLRFKDLFLGGSTDGFTTININNGFTIRDSSDFLLTTVSGGSNMAAVVIATQSSNITKGSPLHLNSQSCSINNTGGERVIIASELSEINNSFRTVIIGGYDVTIATASNSVVYCGGGQGREYDYINSLGVGGTFVLRGVEDDGSGNYNRSEIIQGQTRLTTSNALETPIFSYSWDGTYGEVMQIKAMVMGVDVSDSSLVYSTEILLTGSYLTASAIMIGDPIIGEVSTFGDEVLVTGYVDNNDLEIHVKGSGSNTIQWLCSYKYHRIINIV